VAKPAKGKGAIGISNAPQTIIDVIDARRDGLRWSRSQFALAILEKWYEDGCPAVTPADAAMIDARALMVAEGKQARVKKAANS
jgi:hypothetical protein